MRRSRKRTFNPSAFLTPISIYDLGDPDKDPCFGKLYDLTTPECQSCGDVEFCGLATAQALKKTRLIEEKNGKDLDLKMDRLAQVRDIKKFIKEKTEEGYSSLKAAKLASSKFNIKFNKIREMIA